MIFVDLRLMQTNTSLAFPAEHGRGRRLVFCARCALFGDQLVSHAQSAFRATGSAQVEAVLAVDDHGRYAGDLIGLCLLLGVFNFAFDGERVVSAQELVFIDAFAGQEISHFLWGSELLAVVDGLEHGFVNLVFNAHGFKGDEQLAMNIPDPAKHGRDTYEAHVGRQFFCPRIDGWLEGEAMRAAIPEQLDDFDLARHGNRNGAAQLYILFARFKRLGSLSGHAKQAGTDESGAENQITHMDQRWHQLAPSQIPTDVLAFEAASLKDAGVDYAPVPPRYRTAYFSHSFSGGYSAAYYAYLWSEKLDAESVNWFKENGGLTRKNGDWFRTKLLSRGGSVDALQLFRDFRGRDATVEPLLERRGLNAK